jgi:TRAP-type transport system small permease protein
VSSSLGPEPASPPTSRFDRIAERIENAALALTMAVLVGISGLQLILRSGFDTTLLWADEFLRIVVLWLALLGAIAAARTDRHLRIDVVYKLLGHRAREGVSSLASLVACVVAALLSYEAVRFTQQAWSYGDTVMGDVKQWPFLLIMPVAFALVSAYYLRNGVRHLLSALRGEAPAA